MMDVIGLIRRRLSRDGEAGFTLVELIAAMSILAIGFFSLAGAFSAGARVLVQSRQRQVATEEANGRLEHLRNIPYDQVALEAQLSHTDDAANPDYYVQTGGTGFDYTHTGTYETLVVDTATGEVPHFEDPVTIGKTNVAVYQYVTWIDDPVGGTTTQDYKRLTVVVTYAATTNPGAPKSLQVSAYLTRDNVSVGGTSPGASQGTPSPTPSATPTPTPTPTSGPCSGDSQAPTGTFSILSGTGAVIGYTASTSATVSTSPSDPCGPIQVQLSNDNITYGTWLTFDAAQPTVSWSLTSGDGLKSVWAHFKDGAGNTSTFGPQTITLDMTLPTVPGTLSRTVSCSGSNRTVNLNWGASTDTNLLGYRVYKSTNGAAYAALLTTATQNASDTHSKTLNSVAFKVVGYDKAGNEGTATNVISLAKNQCS